MSVLGGSSPDTKGKQDSDPKDGEWPPRLDADREYVLPPDDTEVP